MSTFFGASLTAAPDGWRGRDAQRPERRVELRNGADMLLTLLLKGLNEAGLFAGLPQASESATGGADPTPTQTITYERAATTSAGKGKRLPFPSDLPRIERLHDLPQSEKAGMKRIGQEVSGKIEYEPGKVYVVRDVRIKYARLDECLDGSVPTVVLAAKPDEGLPKCIAGPSLPAHIVVSKDKGATWNVAGPVPKGACLGPMFGADESPMVVGCPDGLHESKDGGKTWALAVPLAPEIKVLKGGLYGTYGWDPARNIFYASQMMKPAYQYVAK